MSSTKRVAKGVIRVVFAKNPPDAFTTCNTFPVLTPSMDCPFPGWLVEVGDLVEVVKMLADYLNLQIDPVIIGSSIGNVNWGHNHNGNWTGVLGILQQGMADTVATLYPFTEQKAHYFDFSHPVTGVRDMYITKPKRKTISLALWNAFLPYEPKLWALLLLSLAIQCGLASLISSLEYRLNLRSTYSPLEKMWQYLRLQIHQATEFHTPFHLQSGNLSFLFYALIQATLFTQLYTAVLLSALIRGQNPSPWDSYKEMVNLVRTGTYNLVMDKHHLDKDNTFYETLSYNDLSNLRNLADAIKHNPIIVVENVSQALDYVEQGGYILPTKQYSLAYQLSKERCDFFYFEDDNNQISTFFLFKRGSKFLREWNRAIQNNQAFIRRTYEKYFFHEFNTGNIPRCKRRRRMESGEDDEEELYEYGTNGNTNIEASRSLDIVSTFGIFLVALIGFAFAFLAFLCELLIDAKTRRLHRKWRTRRALVFTATNPTHLMAIARQMQEQQRRRMGIVHADSGEAPVDPAVFGPPTGDVFSEEPPRLVKGIEQSWWRRRMRAPRPPTRRPSAIVSAVTLAAISAIRQQQNGGDRPEGEERGKRRRDEGRSPEGRGGAGNILRQRQGKTGGGDERKNGGGWLMMAEVNGTGKVWKNQKNGTQNGGMATDGEARGWARTAF